MTAWRFSKVNLDGLAFPDVDNVRVAINELYACLQALRDTPTMGTAEGYDIAPIYVMEELAKRRLGCVLYRWKPSKRDSEGRLCCPEIRVFFTYLHGRIILLTPALRTGFTYGKDEIYAYVDEACTWKHRIERFINAQGGQS